MGKKLSAKRGRVKTSTKKDNKVFVDNQSILQTSSVRKKDTKALKRILKFLKALKK
jgi:hypothetical protein